MGYSERDLHALTVTQGNLIKRFMGLPKTCRHSILMMALGVRNIQNIHKAAMCSLFVRSLCNNSMAFNVCSFLMTKWLSGERVPHTLVSRLLQFYNPLRVLHGGHHPHRFSPGC